MADQRASVADTKAVVLDAAAQSCAIIEENKAQVAQFAEVRAETPVSAIATPACLLIPVSLEVFALVLHYPSCTCQS